MLRKQIEELAARPTGNYSKTDFELFAQFKDALNRGEVRAAERDETGKWRTNAWVKRGILLGFRMGSIVDMSPSAGLRYFDKHTYPLKEMSTDDRVRIVPG